MPNVKSIEDKFSNFKRHLPLNLSVASDAAKLAAWMDLSAVFCGVVWTDRSSAELDKLARKLSWECQLSVADQQVLNAALHLTYYRFVTAANVIWLAVKPSFTKIVDTQTSDQQQMQELSKVDGILLKENTQRYLAWKAEIALRHGGNYKMYIEQMMEPLSGFADLGEARLQMMRAGENIRMMARTNATMPGRSK